MSYDKAVEAAAREIHADGGMTEELRPATCSTCARSLETARAAIDAALPHLRDGYDREAIAQAVKGAIVTEHIEEPGLDEIAQAVRRGFGLDDGMPDDEDYDIARAVVTALPAPTVSPSVDDIDRSLQRAEEVMLDDGTLPASYMTDEAFRRLAEAIVAADPRESVEDVERRGAVRALRDAADDMEAGGAHLPYVRHLRELADRIEREGQ